MMTERGGDTKIRDLWRSVGGAGNLQQGSQRVDAAAFGRTWKILNVLKAKVISSSTNKNQAVTRSRQRHVGLDIDNVDRNDEEEEYAGNVEEMRRTCKWSRPGGLSSGGQVKGIGKDGKLQVMHDKLTGGVKWMQRKTEESKTDAEVIDRISRNGAERDGETRAKQEEEDMQE